MSQLQQTLTALLPGSPHALIDVRSETEFEQSAIAGFVSLPLLYQSERHQVGICYKTKGQTAAIALGHHLVDPHRKMRVQTWAQQLEASTSKKALLMCWRGGLRSQIATQWLQEAGYDAELWQGGYKKIRQHLLNVLRNPPPLIILSGLTGSGKTELLREFQDSALDLEAIAEHRGSAFGSLVTTQISQTRFENHIALSLFKHRLLLEDESRMLGQLCIPESLLQAMLHAPMIYLEAPLSERLQRIYNEYVALPLEQGISYHQLEARLVASLLKVKKRLNKDYSLINEQLTFAFKQTPSWQAHAPWIEMLLLRYYDPLYKFAVQKAQRTPIFSGDRDSCAAWLLERLSLS